MHANVACKRRGSFASESACECLRLQEISSHCLLDAFRRGLRLFLLSGGFVSWCAGGSTELRVFSTKTGGSMLAKLDSGQMKVRKMQPASVLHQEPLGA